MAIAALESPEVAEFAFRVFVVDCSGSTRGAMKATASVEVIDPGANIGFGPAANLGAAAGTAPVIAFVNPDVALEVGGFEDALRLGMEDGAAAWSGTLRNADGTIQRNSGPPPTLRQLAAEYLLGVDTRLPPPVDRREVSVLTGAVLLVDRKAFTAVGGFSPSLPLFMEDVDLSLRLAAQGPVLQYPIELGVHVGGRSSRHAVRATWTLLHASRVRVYARGRRRDWLAATVIVLGGVSLRALVRDRRSLRSLPLLARACRLTFPLAQLLPPDERVPT